MDIRVVKYKLTERHYLMERWGNRTELYPILTKAECEITKIRWNETRNGE